MKKLILILALVFILTPVTSSAQNYNSDGTVKLDYGGLVKCDGVIDPNEPDRKRLCDFQALIDMANSIIRWVFGLTIPIFVVLIAYAGFLYMTPNPANREKSNKMLWAALKGFVIMLAAWFLVTTFLKWVVDDKFKEAAEALLEQNK